MIAVALALLPAARPSAALDTAPTPGGPLRATSMAHVTRLIKPSPQGGYPCAGYGERACTQCPSPLGGA